MKLIDLQEGRDAPLYHGTTIYQFLSIYRDDVLRGGNTPDSMGHIKSVRVSLDWYVAAQIGQDMDVSGVVIGLDQSRLAHTYKMIPYADQRACPRSGDDSESEEMIITDGISPLSKYVIDYKIDPDSLDHVIDEWPSAETNKYLRGWDITDATEVIDKIRNDPKVVRFGGVYL